MDKRLLKRIISLIMVFVICFITTGCKVRFKAGNGSVSRGDILDLTKMSKTMVYSEVSNMMISPHDYDGRKVKMKGNMNIVKYKQRMNYTCIIQDATACCAQGIEFVCKGDLKYPDDYPKEGEEIEVEGTFEVYTSEELEYVRLKNATVKKL